MHSRSTVAGAAALCLAAAAFTSCTPAKPKPLPGPPYVARISESLGTVAIAWTEARTNGYPIIGWRVARNGVDAHGTGAWSTVLPAAATQFRFLSLKPNTAYTVSVRAITLAGQGAATSKTVTDRSSYAFQGPCSTPGLRATGNFSNVCDGFEWTRFIAEPSVWGIRARRVAGGVTLSWLMGSYLTASGHTVKGRLSQLGGPSVTFDGGGISYGKTVGKTVTVHGAFKPGHATFTVSGEGAVPAGPFTFSKKLGVVIP